MLSSGQDLLWTIRVQQIRLALASLSEPLCLEDFFDEADMELMTEEVDDVVEVDRDRVVFEGAEEAVRGSV